MDDLPSYTRCQVHPSFEDCFEHALNRKPQTVLQSDRIKECLRKFMSSCTLEERAELLGLAQPNFRPLAPEPIKPCSVQAAPGHGPTDTLGLVDAPSSFGARDRPDGASGPVQRCPLPAKPTLRPRPVTNPSAMSRDHSPQPSRSTHPQQTPNSHPRKRKRTLSNSIETISSGLDNHLSASETDSDSQRTSSRRRTSLQVEGENGLEPANTIDPKIQKTYFKDVNFRKIEPVLKAFLPVESCERFSLQSVCEIGRGLAPRGLLSESDRPSKDNQILDAKARLQKHVEHIKTMDTSAANAKKSLDVHNRLTSLLIQFEVEILKSNDDAVLPPGFTRQAHAIQAFAESWGGSEDWVKRKLREAKLWLMLIENHPSYITELDYRNSSKWLALTHPEIRAVLQYFQECQIRKSSNRKERDFIVCQRIIEHLTMEDWTFSEILGSKCSILRVLSKHVDLSALSEGQIRPLSPAQVDLSSQTEVYGESQANPLSESSSSAATQQGRSTELSYVRSEASLETGPAPDELQHHGWGYSPDLDLNEVFRFGDVDGPWISEFISDTFFDENHHFVLRTPEETT
ncbi:hypothetical protein B0J12DRAFT_461261 [Macrophomina phaseolina]|uniref:Uncharacterized protein n=1 Tax=Macrophomina phaseolina TaxID=35725 RepID=A0ABQ8FT96_9PEZI|nr:hypothetical protein B0J12DRAFT_461261 [Macrophomina phaseolina]